MSECVCVCVCVHTYIYYVYVQYVCICREGDRARMYLIHINFERQRRKDVFDNILTQKTHKTTGTHKRPETPKVIPGGIFLFEECV